MEQQLPTQSKIFIDTISGRAMHINDMGTIDIICGKHKTRLLKTIMANQSKNTYEVYFSGDNNEFRIGIYGIRKYITLKSALKNSKDFRRFVNLLNKCK